MRDRLADLAPLRAWLVASRDTPAASSAHGAIAARGAPTRSAAEYALQPGSIIMKTHLLPFVLLAAAAAPVIAGPGRAVQPTPARLQLAVTSTAFTANDRIPPEFTCEGSDKAPPLQWSTVPQGTRSVALLVDDADAPKGTFTQWLVTGISPITNSIGKDALPQGAVAAKNSKGTTGYSGPCPQESGKHRYYFHVFALDTHLAAPADKAAFLAAINGHILAEGQLMGTYQTINTP
jgi:Raf kinase inhibitor-like YbhB/YbcL family protein